jgi:hypothetical protein
MSDNEVQMLMQITISREISKKDIPQKAKKVKETHLKGEIDAIKQKIRVNALEIGKPLYQHLSTKKNPLYEEGLQNLPFESCLIHDKAYKNREGFLVQTAPKWLTNLGIWKKDENGYMDLTEIYSTNNHRASNHRKIRSLDSFCKYYQPLYKSKKVTLLFLTFTRTNHAKKSWHSMVKIVKNYFEREGNKVLDYLWTSEVSEDLHWHYHLAIAIDRVQWKKIPKRFFFERLWGQRTEIDFVKKNIRHYMAKYFAKSNYRIEGLMSYGGTKNYKKKIS